MSAPAAQRRVSRRRSDLWRGRPLPKFLQSWSARIALSVLLLVLAIAFLGRFVAPYSPTALVGAPYQPPSGKFVLGTDYLGEDVFSRVLYGGSHMIVFAVLATSLAYLIGGFVGLLAGFSRSLIDPILMRSVDLLLAFPALFLILLLATRFGTSPEVILIGVALIHIPMIARIVRTATLETSVSGYVEAALARGDSTLSILRRQILPNIIGPARRRCGPEADDFRLGGRGPRVPRYRSAPPTPDWARMINENNSGISINAWPWRSGNPDRLLTISVNIVADASRAAGATPSKRRSSGEPQPALVGRGPRRLPCDGDPIAEECRSPSTRARFSGSRASRAAARRRSASPARLYAPGARIVGRKRPGGGARGPRRARGRRYGNCAAARFLRSTRSETGLNPSHARRGHAP